VAVAINALIVPPDHLDTVAEKLRDFAGRLSRLFGDLGAMLGSADVAIEPEVLLERARALHDQAGPAVRARQDSRWFWLGSLVTDLSRVVHELRDAFSTAATGNTN
jgi:hypothetical protein